MASFETVARIGASIESQEIPYAIVGGTVTGALTDSETLISPTDKQVVAPLCADTKLIRDNGTRRDADILVLSSDETVIAEAKARAAEASNNELTVSVFGFQRWREYETKKERFAAEALHYYTSTREQDENGIIFHRLYPLQATIPWSLLEGWHMRLPNDLGSVRVMDPRYHVLSYATRSVGGLRAKDAAKYALAQAKVAAAFEGQNARDVQNAEELRDRLEEIRTTPLVRSLREHGFIAAKSKALHLAERQTWIVDAFQKLRLDERLLKRFVN